jgi:hypothetical protein
MLGQVLNGIFCYASEEYRAATIERTVNGRRIDAGDALRAGAECPI